MTTAQLATIPTREHLAMRAIHSLSPQVNRLRVCLNSYNHIPHWLNGSEVVRLDNLKGDAGKIYGLPDDGYIFLCDDDLIYPPDYVSRMTERLEEENNRVILTCHGRIMNPKPVRNSYTDRREAFHCLKDVEYDGVVSIGGTGVMAFHTSYFYPIYDRVESKNMLDIWIAKFASEQHCIIKMMPHPAGWIQYQNPEWTIWEDAFKNPDEQTYLYNSF